MMSTIGRIPVIAAPTAIPVKPASEIGVSSTRSLPNSSTSPVRTLNTVPASAMSSPHMKTRESRRISSAIASRTASPNVSSRVAVTTSGIDIVIYLVRRWVGSRSRKLYGSIDLRFDFFLNTVELRAIRKFLFHKPIAEQRNRIALGLPHLLFLFRAVVFATDVAHMVSQEPIRLANKKCGSGARSYLANDIFCCRIDSSDILPINASALDSKSRRARQHVAGNRLRVVCVFVVKVV